MVWPHCSIYISVCALSAGEGGVTPRNQNNYHTRFSMQSSPTVGQTFCAHSMCTGPCCAA